MSQHACRYQEDRNAVLAQWLAQICRLRLLVERADECIPAEFVKKLDDTVQELRRAAMGTVIQPASCDEKEK